MTPSLTTGCLCQDRIQARQPQLCPGEAAAVVLRGDGRRTQGQLVRHTCGWLCWVEREGRNKRDALCSCDSSPGQGGCGRFPSCESGVGPWDLTGLAVTTPEEGLLVRPLRGGLERSVMGKRCHAEIIGCSANMTPSNSEPEENFQRQTFTPPGLISARRYPIRTSTCAPFLFLEDAPFSAPGFMWGPRTVCLGLARSTFQKGGSTWGGSVWRSRLPWFRGDWVAGDGMLAASVPCACFLSGSAHHR